MKSLADIQTDLARAVITHDASPLQAALAGDAFQIARFAIHQRHYEQSLTAALLTKFPATAWLVGEEPLRAVAKVYVHAAPPRGPCITEYGDGFPAFLAEDRRFSKLPYLRSFAELEWMLGQASIAISAPALDWAGVVSVGVSALMSSVLTLQPGVRYFGADWPVDSLIRYYLDDSAPERLILEPEEIHVEVRGVRGNLGLARLARGDFHFRKSLNAGETIGTAAAHALDHDPGFNAGAALRRVINSGTAINISSRGEDKR